MLWLLCLVFYFGKGGSKKATLNQTGWLIHDIFFDSSVKHLVHYVFMHIRRKCNESQTRFFFSLRSNNNFKGCFWESAGSLTATDTLKFWVKLKHVGSRPHNDEWSLFFTGSVLCFISCDHWNPSTNMKHEWTQSQEASFLFDRKQWRNEQDLMCEYSNHVMIRIL